MRNSHAFNDQNQLIIPDFWPGSICGNIRHLKDTQHGTEYYLNKWQELKCENLHKVLLSCDDNYISNGVRSILSQVNNIHLKTLKDKNSMRVECQSFFPDTIIWGMNSFQDLCNHIGDVIYLRKEFKSTTQIVFCDELPEKALGKDSFIKGLTLISGRMKVPYLSDLITTSLGNKDKIFFSIKNILSTRQLEVLDSYANDMTTKNIALKYEIDSKTVLTHKYQAFRSLGTTSRSQKANLTQAIGKIHQSLRDLKIINSLNN